MPSHRSITIPPPLRRVEGIPMGTAKGLLRLCFESSFKHRRMEAQSLEFSSNTMAATISF